MTASVHGQPVAPQLPDPSTGSRTAGRSRRPAPAGSHAGPGLARAVLLDTYTELRIGLGSLAPAPVRARNAEAAIVGRALGELPFEAARAALAGDISPIDDVRASAHFRSVVAGNVLVRMLKELASS